MSLLNKTIENFYKNSNSEISEGMSKYLRNLFPCLGIKKPVRVELQKDFLSEVKKSKKIDWQVIDNLWNMPEREFHYLALEILMGMSKSLTPKDLLKIKKLIETKSWWDTVDGLAGNCVNNIILKNPDELSNTISNWINDDNLWIRRSSIICQLKSKKNTNTEFLSKAIKDNLGSNEFFINKAIGWALREYSKTDKFWVKNFIDENRQKLSNLSIREGSKYV